MNELQIFLSIGSVLISVGIAWGIISTKVRRLEHQMDVLSKDHDLLVEIKTKLDLLLRGKLK
jgi:hypothetical protein